MPLGGRHITVHSEAITTYPKQTYMSPPIHPSLLLQATLYCQCVLHRPGELEESESYESWLPQSHAAPDRAGTQYLLKP